MKDVTDDPNYSSGKRPTVTTSADAVHVGFVAPPAITRDFQFSTSTWLAAERADNMPTTLIETMNVITSENFLHAIYVWTSAGEEEHFPLLCYSRRDINGGSWTNSVELGEGNVVETSYKRAVTNDDYGTHLTRVSALGTTRKQVAG